MSLIKCNYYPKCGGCQLLHLTANAYIIHKQDIIVQAFLRHGITIDRPPVLQLGAGMRRRATFKLREGGVGFFSPHSHRLVPLTKCEVLTPPLSNLLSPLKKLYQWFPKGGDMEATYTDTGTDLNIITPTRPSFSLAQIEALTAFIHQHRWARVSINGILFLENVSPQVIIDDIPVGLTPGSFLQASTAMEKALATFIHKTIPPFSKALDLFCGRGTLSLPLSRLGAVDAFESNKDAVKDLSKAAQAHKRPLTVTNRDLFKDPLKDKELHPYDWIILNPPRAGAATQIKALAPTQAPIVYVSCCPETLARDCKILLKAGRTLHGIQAIDAFYGSRHVETLVIIK